MNSILFPSNKKLTWWKCLHPTMDNQACNWMGNWFPDQPHSLQNIVDVFPNKMILFFSFFQSKPEEVIDAVKFAIDAGYRHIDCAAVYLNEKDVGKAIGDKIKEGVVKREDIYITSKVS